MDGKLLHSMPVDMKPSKLVYFNPFSAEEMRLYLPEGDHTFRAGFIDDEFMKTLSDADARDIKKNRFLDSMIFAGPFPSKLEKPSPNPLLIYHLAVPAPVAHY